MYLEEVLSDNALHFHEMVETADAETVCLICFKLVHDGVPCPITEGPFGTEDLDHILKGCTYAHVRCFYLESCVKCRRLDAPITKTFGLDALKFVAFRGLTGEVQDEDLVACCGTCGV